MKKKLILATMLTSLTLLPVNAVLAREIPLIDTSVNVDYAAQIDFVTGGVGDEERAEIEAVKGRYNLHITQARTDGAFVEDVKTVVSRKNAGKFDEILSVNAGPLLYIQLDPGTYQIDSTRAGRDPKRQQVVLTSKTKSKDISFTWKPMLEVQ